MAKRKHPRPGETLDDVSLTDDSPLSPKKSGKECMKCGRRQPLRNYQQLTRNPASYAPICMACVADNDAREIRSTIRSNEMKRKFQSEQRRVINLKRKERKEIKAKNDAQRQANAELASRMLARRRLLPFIKRFKPDYMDGWVHRLICRELEQFSLDIAAQRSPRLQLWLPPRIGKSEIASKNFPSWHMGKYPHHEVIAASYAVSLPEGFSRSNRDRLGDPAFQTVFPDCKLDQTAQAATGWRTTAGGGYVPAGVGGGITGKGAHLLVIDDPFKDAEESDSETYREKVWNWYSSTAYTRLSPGGGVLLINTRWHDDDLSGRTLRKNKETHEQCVKMIDDIRAELETGNYSKQRRGELIGELLAQQKRYGNLEKWKILMFPQEATQDEYYETVSNKIVYEPTPGTVLVRQKGQVLHPERYTPRDVQLQKDTLQKRHWNALHQQNPVPDDGDYFKKDEMRRTRHLHDWRWSNVYLAGDVAAGTKQQNDWNVYLVGALDYNKVLHIVDMVRFKGGTKLKVDNLAGVLEKYQSKMVRWGLEKGQIQMSIWDPLMEELAERGLAVPYDDSLTPITDKEARARTAQGMFQQGRILLPDDQPWVDTFEAELLRFPNGLHDDIVDAVAWLAKMTVREHAPRRRAPKVTKSWRDDLTAHIKSQRGGRDPMGA